MDPKELIKNLFLDALEECSPSRAVDEAISKEGKSLRIGQQQLDLLKRPVYLFAVGKAAVPMYNAAAEILDDHIEGSFVITSDEAQSKKCNADEVLVGDHPKPGERSVLAAKNAIQFLETIPGDAVTINLLSGGTSSLLCLPPEEITVEDISRTYELLINSGAGIHEINTVRKHCSQVKGGQLLRYLDPEITLIDLAISDVPGDDISMIGSGPTIPDLSTYQDAYHILLEYDLWDQLPQKVQQYFEMAIDGQQMETVRPNLDPIKEHYSYIISSAGKLAKKISEQAMDSQINSWISGKSFNDDVEEVAAFVAEKVCSDKDIEPFLYIFFGESTVEVRGNGKGGRNQELALRGALKIEGQSGVTWLSAGTDGVDGPTDAAGAIVDGKTIPKAKAQGLDPQEFLDKNDSYYFHQQMGTLFKTGPTGNNLMDVVLVLVEQ